MRESIISLAEKHRTLFELFPQLASTDEVLVLVFPTYFRRNAYTEDMVPFERAFPGRSQKKLEKTPDFVFEELIGFFLTESGVSTFTEWHDRGDLHVVEVIPYEKLAGVKRRTDSDGKTYIYLRFLEGDCNNACVVSTTLWCPNEKFAEKFLMELLSLLQSKGRLSVEKIQFTQGYSTI